MYIFSIYQEIFLKNYKHEHDSLLFSLSLSLFFLICLLVKYFGNTGKQTEKCSLYFFYL